MDISLQILSKGLCAYGGRWSNWILQIEAFCVLFNRSLPIMPITPHKQHIKVPVKIQLDLLVYCHGLLSFLIYPSVNFETHLEHDCIVSPPNIRLANDRPNVARVTVAIVTERGDLLGVGERRREVVRVEVA